MTAKMKSRPTDRSPTGAHFSATPEFYLGLISAMLKDMACVCYQIDSETDRDIEEIRRRTSTEGMSFLTKTLPSLGKAIDLALSTDTTLNVTGFKLARESKLPRFMRGYFSMVFEPDGRERSDASPQAIKALRQISYLFYKLNLPSTEEQNNEVIACFRNTEHDLPYLGSDCSDHDRRVLREARNLIARVLAETSPRDAVLFGPRHGPGAVATGEKSWEKPIFKRYYRALAREFPYEDWFFFSLSHLCDDLSVFQDMEELESGTAKVVLVPKDSRGPRLISCEPLEYQWIQQGLMNVLVHVIERHPLTRGRVNFTDQTVNQTLALEASLNGKYATLDMKEASDRVSLELVELLFPATWFAALKAARTTHTKLPDGDVLQLRKFAPMGSAVCFPVEALVFWALSVAVASYGKGKLGRREALSNTFVYGDDIICLSKDQAEIRRHLPKFGLMFNERKCCTGRFFRESCGVDAYKGVSVTPLKVRAVWSRALAGVDYASWVAYYNDLNERGLFNACDYLSGEIQSVRRTPYADDNKSEVVALVDCRKMALQANKELKIPCRFNRRTHVLEVLAWKVRSRPKQAAVPGWSEMQRVASYKSERFQKERPDSIRNRFNPMADRLAPAQLKSHFLSEAPEAVVVTAYQYALPRRATLKRGWGRL